MSSNECHTVDVIMIIMKCTRGQRCTVKIEQKKYYVLDPIPIKNNVKLIGTPKNAGIVLIKITAFRIKLLLKTKK